MQTKLPPDPGWMGDISRGAGLGRPSRGTPCSCGIAGSHKFTLRRCRLDSGGYDSGGAYWGIGQPLYWAQSDDGTAEMFLRADDRDDARKQVLSKHPGAKFYR